MSKPEKDFEISLSAPGASAATQQAVETASDATGFPSRDPALALVKRARKQEPKAQMHPYFSVQIYNEIMEEANTKNVAYGDVLEEAWKFYKANT